MTTQTKFNALVESILESGLQGDTCGLAVEAAVELKILRQHWVDVANSNNPELGFEVDHAQDKVNDAQCRALVLAFEECARRHRPR